MRCITQSNNEEDKFIAFKEYSEVSFLKHAVLPITKWSKYPSKPFHSASENTLRNSEENFCGGVYFWAVLGVGV